MRFFKITSLILLIITLSFLSSCEKDNLDGYETFTIKIDSIQVPQNIHTVEPFDIKFFGVIGPNGCYEFYKFKTGISNDVIKVKVLGKVKTSEKTGNCPAVMMYLNGEVLTQYVEMPGYYLIKIEQPDGDFLEKEIFVK